MNSNRKYILIFSGLVIFCIVLLWGVILPTLTDIKSYNNQIDQEKIKLSKLLKQGQSVVENKKNLKQLKSEINILDTAWLKTGDELIFITDLENIAEKNNLEQNIVFDNTKITALTGSTDIKTIPIELKINGQMNDIMHYINQLEALDYYINLTKIDLHSQNNNTKKYPTQINADEQITPEDTMLSANLSGITYWQ